MADKIIEGLWDCRYCGEKGIGGLTKTCPHCGHAQDKDIKFYLGSQKKYLDEETAKNYGKGEDWTCSYCESLNRYNVEECANCGAPREKSLGSYSDNQKRMEQEKAAAIKDAKARYRAGVLEARAKAEEEAKEKARARAQALKEEEAARKAARALTPEQKKKRLIKILAIAAGGVALFIGLMLLIFMPRQRTMTLEDKGWNRNIVIQEYKTLRESDWTVPEGGRVQYERSEFHHYDKVLDHYETRRVAKTREVADGYDTYTDTVDNGDGTFSEKTYTTTRYKTETYYEDEEVPVYKDVPVNQTKYYYDIERWVDAREVVTSGGATDEPYWGEYELQDKEKEARRGEQYSLILREEKGQLWAADVPEDVYAKYEIGDSMNAKIKVGRIKELNGDTINYGLKIDEYVK